MTLIFHDSPGAQAGRVIVPRPVIQVSRVSTPATDEEGTWPVYDEFTDEPRLKILNIFQGSSISGPSYADIQFVGGRIDQGDTQIEVEHAGNVLATGDRVALGYDKGGATEWLFSGYCTRLRATIDQRDAVVWRVMGPEYAWGTEEGTDGGGVVIYGQIRRESTADAAFVDSSETITGPDGLRLFTDFPCIFNPAGRKNMSKTDAVETGGYGFRPFEEPERVGKDAEELSDYWNSRKAIAYLFGSYGTLAQGLIPGMTVDPTAIGIELPDADAVGEVVGANRVVRDVSIEGVPFWEALRRIVEPEFGFYVTCNPVGGPWGGFKLVLFARSQDVDGTSANLVLNARGTPLASASASVVRLDVARDISKVVNRTTVLGKRIKFIRLAYYGGQTPSITATPLRTMLQHGWTTDDIDLSTYSAESAVPGTDEISPNSLASISATNSKQWADRFTTTGKQFAKYRHAARHFVWNEAAEFVEGDADPHYGSGGDMAYKVPDLTGIADDPDNPDRAGMYCRRRRPALETLYLSDSGVDVYNRHPPALYLCSTAAGSPNTNLPTTGWLKVPEGHWRLDPDRCGFFITASDLATWNPYQDYVGEIDEFHYDYRSFATLLFTGRLRMLFECCVETDWAFEKSAEKQDESGNPMIRQAVFRRDRDFLKSSSFINNPGSSPSGLSPVDVDHSTDVQAYADSVRSAGQDAQTHASVLVAADWPKQKIGKVITNISGRNIDLSSNGGGRGAQIVAYNMDFTAFKWELLTASAALELRKIHTKRFSRRHRREGKYRTEQVE